MEDGQEGTRLEVGRQWGAAFCIELVSVCLVPFCSGSGDQEAQPPAADGTVSPGSYSEAEEPHAVQVHVPEGIQLEPRTEFSPGLAASCQLPGGGRSWV